MSDDVKAARVDLVQRGVDAIREEHHSCALNPSVPCGELAVVDALTRYREALVNVRHALATEFGGQSEHQGVSRADVIARAALDGDGEEGSTMTGAERIAAERQRQVEEEGWTPEHDQDHSLRELVDAAICYAVAARREQEFGGQAGYPTAAHPVPDRWPWDPEDWKPSDDPVRMLEKAGALIAAEIDRLTRAALDGDR